MKRSIALQGQHQAQRRTNGRDKRRKQVPTSGGVLRRFRTRFYCILRGLPPVDWLGLSEHACLHCLCGWGTTCRAQDEGTTCWGYGAPELVRPSGQHSAVGPEQHSALRAQLHVGQQLGVQ